MDNDRSKNGRTTIIAEIGENHAGDMELARRMIVEAARAGVDMVKFQSYLFSDVDDDDPEKEWLAKVQLPDRMHLEFKQLADEHGVEFLSTPFSVSRARFLCEEVGLRKMKIASSEMLNFPLLDYVAQRAETVFLSTGLSTIAEIGRALDHLVAVPRVAILHCVTSYPTADHEANLRAIEVLRGAFPHRAVGYSDHTLGICAPVAAVALGATVVEKHFTLDKSLPGTDQALSASPSELRQMVEMIRRVEVLLGAPEKKPTAHELEILDVVRQRFPKDGR